MKIISITVVSLLLAGCTVSKDDTTAALEEQGYTTVELGGPALLGCGESDTFTRVWTATAQNGTRVKGVACSTLFKGLTIRRTGKVK